LKRRSKVLLVHGRRSALQALGLVTTESLAPQGGEEVRSTTPTALNNLKDNKASGEGYGWQAEDDTLQYKGAERPRAAQE